MADVQNPSPFRFARQVAPSAPKPGHHLATASFQMDKELFILWVIEGPPNDAFGFLGMASSFEATRKLRFAIRGPLIERLNDLPQPPFERGLVYRFSPTAGGEQERIVLQQATTVFSGLRAENRADPDSAAVAYDLFGGVRVLAAITGFQRGWYWQVLTPAVGLAIWALRTNPADGQAIELSVQQDSDGVGGRVAVTGTVTFRDSILASFGPLVRTTLEE